MPTVEEITTPLRSTYTTVLPAGPGVCAVCHSQPGPGFRTCFSCETTMRAVTYPVERVVPISLAEKSGQLYHALKRYKAVALPWDVTSQRTFRIQLAALVGRFIDRHARCIASSGDGWDTIVVVPSTRSDPGEAHALHDALSMLRGIAPLDRPLRASTEEFGPREAGDLRFEVIHDVSGQRILLVDDTMTTGAHLQSAASALTLRGATVVAAVPIARLINVEYSPDVWTSACAVPYDFDRCCLEDQ